MVKKKKKKSSMRTRSGDDLQDVFKQKEQSAKQCLYCLKGSLYIPLHKL